MRTGSYCTVWEVKPSTNYTDVRISCSRKNKNTGEYIQDYSGYVRFIGTAHQNAGSLKEKDRIKLGDIDITNSYNKEKNITYTNVAVFSFEMADGSQSSQTTAPKKEDKFENIPESLDEELPFN